MEILRKGKRWVVVSRRFVAMDIRTIDDMIKKITVLENLTKIGAITIAGLTVKCIKNKGV